MPFIPWYHSNSPGSLLKSTADFIIHLNKIAPNFDLPQNEIGNLQLAAADLKANCEKALNSRPSLHIAGTEKHKRMLEVKNIAVRLTKRLKGNPNWSYDCDEARNLDLLLHKADSAEPDVKKRDKVGYYSNEWWAQIMTQIKYLNNILNTDDRFVVATNDVEILRAAIDAAEKSLVKHRGAYHLQKMLSAEQSASLFKLKNAIKSVINYLQDNKAWTNDHALMLNVHYLTRSTKIVKCTPVFEVRDCEKYVCINFAKIGINGMNVYTRTGGEVDFTFLDYVKRTGYKDPRPINPYVSETREYRLNAVVEGKEIGEPSDVKSIRVGGYKEVRTLPRI